jgi:hypothetical protein
MKTRTLRKTLPCLLTTLATRNEGLRFDSSRRCPFVRCSGCDHTDGVLRARAPEHKQFHPKKSLNLDAKH